jgi:hypothetical protein
VARGGEINSDSDSDEAATTGLIASIDEMLEERRRR